MRKHGAFPLMFVWTDALVKKLATDTPAFADLMSRASPDFTPEVTRADDPAMMIYTSGTTGQPKGVVRDNGGHMVALKWSMSAIYGIDPGETYWAASDVGWVVGHSYIVYAPLLLGCATVLYEGKPVGTPDAGAFWRVVAEHKVAALFTAPTAFRAIKKEDPDGTFMPRYDLSGFRTLFLAELIQKLPDLSGLDDLLRSIE